MKLPDQYFHFDRLYEPLTSRMSLSSNSSPDVGICNLRFVLLKVFVWFLFFPALPFFDAS